MDREVKEKEKILSDLEKAEKLKNQLAAEVDEHHSAIEQKNSLNLRSFVSSRKASQELLGVSVTPFLCLPAGSLNRTTRRSWRQ